MTKIFCFVGASCGFDLLKGIYKDRCKVHYTLFDLVSIQKSLADLLYSFTAGSGDLPCADPTGNAVPCVDGFCRSISDGNGLVTYSNCLRKSVAPLHLVSLSDTRQWIRPVGINRQSSSIATNLFATRKNRQHKFIDC